MLGLLELGASVLEPDGDALDAERESIGELVDHVHLGIVRLVEDGLEAVDLLLAELGARATLAAIASCRWLLKASFFIAFVP